MWRQAKMSMLALSFYRLRWPSLPRCCWEGCRVSFGGRRWWDRPRSAALCGLLWCPHPSSRRLLAQAAEARWPRLCLSSSSTTSQPANLQHTFSVTWHVIVQDCLQLSLCSYRKLPLLFMLWLYCKAIVFMASRTIIDLPLSKKRFWRSQLFNA